MFQTCGKFHKGLQAISPVALAAIESFIDVQLLAGGHPDAGIAHHDLDFSRCGPGARNPYRAALREFQVEVTDLTCLDVGASTGGFTDCLLQHDARKVVAIDVGHNQFDWRLRTDPRVELREGVNARYLKPEDFDDKFDLVAIDVSFISLTKILPAIAPLLKDRGRLIALIKPQFEVGKGEVGKGGIVTETAKHQQVIQQINHAAKEFGLEVCGLIESPISGAEGNREILAMYEHAISNTKTRRH